MTGKILLVGPILKTYGGVSRFQEDLLNSNLDYKILHFNTARPPKNRSYFTLDGYKELINAGLKRTILSILITIWHVLKLPYILLREAPDTVHIASVTYWVFWESAAYLFISKFMGIKVVFHMLGPFDVFYQKSGAKIKRLIQFVLRRADRIICLSDRDKELMGNFLSPENISVLRSNVHLPSDQPAGPDRKGRERVEVLFIGGVDPFRKGIYDILKALPIVIDQCEGIKFTLTGGENTQRALKEALDPCFMPWISYQGWISDVQKWILYQNADLLLLPSHEEGLPYVLIEAMAYGLPIITTPVGGIPEVVRDGKNGFLIDPGDYEALANRIIHLSRDEPLRLSMGNVNRDEFRRSYSQEFIFKDLDAIYRNLIEN